VWRLDPARARLHGAERARRALVFDGAGDSAVAGLGGLRLRAPFTVSARVRLARGARGGPVVVGEPGRGFVLGVRPGETRWRGGLRVEAGVRPGRWARVALAWNGKRASVSVDGKVVASRRVRAASLGRATRVRVGGDPGARAWLRGRVSRVALTAG
jgi:hypothetical protein